MPKPFTARNCGPLRGRITVPGDKSISHRALILGTLAIGETRISGLLESADVLATARALQLMGGVFERGERDWLVIGRGLGGLQAPCEALDFGNSGTGARLLMGVVAGHDVKAVFTGDASLCRRPMSRVLTPLKEMGLRVLEDGQAGRLPLTLAGTSDLVPIVYRLPVPSAQVKSAILLAGLFAPGETTVIEPIPTRDHTETMLAYFGADLRVEEGTEGRAITVVGEPVLHGREVAVPGDPSSAAFPAAAALIRAGSEIVIENVLVNPTRTGFYETVLEMGGVLKFENRRVSGGEPVADLRVMASTLKGVTVPAERAPRMIDEYPVLAVVAAFAEGETRMEGLAELRVKESDRLASTLAGLISCGVNARAEGDTLIVQGGTSVPGGGAVRTEMDHRIAMAFLTLGLAAEAPVSIDDATMIDTSFPGFVDLMQQLGAGLMEPEGAAP